jgi:hypothetical protein
MIQIDNILINNILVIKINLKKLMNLKSNLNAIQSIFRQ